MNISLVVSSVYALAGAAIAGGLVIGSRRLATQNARIAELEAERDQELEPAKLPDAKRKFT